MMRSVRDRRRAGSEAWGRGDEDEPTPNLDPMRTREKRQWKREECADEG